MKFSRLRAILERQKDPYLNLAMDEAILTSVALGKSLDTLRLWVDTRSLILGSSIRIETVNLALCEELGIPVVRRCSGGGVVYHDEGNLNWSFVAKHSSRELFSAYEYVGGLIADSLRMLDISAKFVKPNRIEVNGKKLSGMAGRFKQDTLLIHGTLLVSSNLDLLNRLCPPLPNTPPVTSLEEVLGHKVEMGRVADAIISSLKSRAVDVEKAEPTPFELGLARELYEKKYSLLSWNVGIDDHRMILCKGR